MRNFAPIFWNSTTGSGLYCVWVLVHDDGGDRLVSIWIEPAATAFKSQPQETTWEIDPAADPFVRHEGNDVNRLDAENLRCVLPLCS